MAEGGESGEHRHGKGPKSAFAVDSSGGRVRFTVELHPQETTFVSWTKLLKEANLGDSNRPESSTGPSFEAQPSFVFQPPLSPPVEAYSIKQRENELKDSQDQAGSNRLNTVIENIHAENGSSEEEDLILENVPDDDEYDTEDSFIDDTELDDYVQVDNSVIEHDGLFVNRGKLECIDPIISTNQQPKKRRNKDLTRGAASDGGRTPHKIMKKGHKGLQNDEKELQGTSAQRPSDKKSLVNKYHSEEKLDNADGLDLFIHKRLDLNAPPDDLSVHERFDLNAPPGHLSIHERFDLNAPPERAFMQFVETATTQGTEGPSLGPKTTALEKAIEDLENIVAELRPPSTEAPDPKNASQATKGKLPPEIKLKLAEICGRAHAKYGKVPEYIIDRLMSIVGHLMCIRTLKRNLEAIAKLGLSAQQEKND